MGIAGHEVQSGAAYYWDDAGIHRLADPFSAQSAAYCISPNSDFIGGFVSQDDLSEDGILHAAVWDSQRQLILLKDAQGNPFQGKVLDVSNHGYAVGETRDGRGFIWHPTFDGVQSPFNGAQYFEDWLAAVPGGTTLPFASKGVEAIAEDPVDGQLLFALSDYEAPGASAFVEVDVARIAAEIAVDVAGTDLPDNTGNVNFGTTTRGAPINQTITIRNTGGADLILQPASFASGSGFTITTNFAANQVLAAGDSTSLIVQMGAVAGSQNAVLSFANSDADEGLFDFTVMGTVTPSTTIIVAPASYEFRDMGFDPVLQEVGIVGYEGTGTIGVTKIAKLFELNEAGNGFTAQTLVGFGTPTQVFGVSSEGSRIVGQSKSFGSINGGEATSWLRSDPQTPIALGFVAWTGKTSAGVSAWKDGVVGSSGGGAAAMKWTESTGMIELGGHSGFVGEAKDVSFDGSITVGFAGHEVEGGAAYYWDSSGIHRLDDPFGAQSVVYAISPNSDFIGGFVSQDDLSEDGIQHAAVWDSQRQLILLKDAQGNPFQGKVLDVSNHGYAVGETRDGRGFIWHPTFDGVQSQFNGAQYFEDWLAAVPGGTTLPFALKGVEAIAEDPVDGQLLFCLSDYEAPGASAFVEVDVAGIGVPAKPVPNFQHVPYRANSAFNLTWDAAENANSYIVQINNLSTGKVERKVAATSPQLSVTIAQPGNYTVWVQGVGANGQHGPWSDATNFTVVTRPPAIIAAGSTLRWTDIAASQYRLWVNDQNGVKVFDHTGSETSFDISLPFGTYTAWVKPDADAWSTPYRFGIYHDAIAVHPLTTLDATPVVSWTGPADGNYLVWVSVKGHSAAVVKQNVTGNSVELPALARGVYTVWVRQLFPDGSFSLWGTGSTLNVAQRPVLSLAGSVLSWSSYANASQYELWLSTDLTTDRITVSPAFVSALSIDLSSLSLATRNYRVWIRAVSDGSAGLFATSPWGYARAFTV